MNELQLKIEHYKQRVAELSVQYEERIADIRVQFTLAQERINELEQQLDAEEVSEETDVLAPDSE